MEAETTKIILDVLKSSPTFGVLALAIVWFARRDVLKYIAGVGKYADDYLQLKRDMVDVGRDSATATKELGEAIAKSMDRFETVATGSLASWSAELQSFRRDMTPILRAARSPEDASGDLLLVSANPTHRARSAVSGCCVGGRLIVATSLDDALSAIAAYAVRAVIVDATVSAASVDALATIGVAVVLLTEDDKPVDVGIKRAVRGELSIDELSHKALSDALKGSNNVEIIDLPSSGRVANGRL